MAQRRHHYERAFETLLRRARIPYVAVNEAKRALLPKGAVLACDRAGVGAGVGAGSGRGPHPGRLKNFDFVVYGEGTNLLVEIKGRRLPTPADTAPTAGLPRLESWVSLDDVEAMGVWEQLFGEGFEAVFVFLYAADDQPPDGLFTEFFEHDGRWYTTRAVRLGDYKAAMKTRSPRWRTVDLPTQTYAALSVPFVAPPPTATPALDPHRSDEPLARPAAAGSATIRP